MKFWIWGPTIIWHNLGCVAFYFSKSLHPTVHIYHYTYICSNRDRLGFLCGDYFWGDSVLHTFWEDVFLNNTVYVNIIIIDNVTMIYDAVKKYSTINIQMYCRFDIKKVHN